VELQRTGSGFFLGRVDGGRIFKQFLGGEDDLIRNVHDVAKTASLDGGEEGYILAELAKVKA
jgi:hypothetical protein